MRLQNRLQQAFRKRLRPGMSACRLTFETAGLKMFRARIHVPVIGVTIDRDWTEDEESAQLNASQRVIEFLDANKDYVL